MSGTTTNEPYRRIPSIMKNKAKNLGIGYGGCFCMAFIFTAEGVKVVTGSMDRIRSYTEYWPPCHGIIHRYFRDGIVKDWYLFGRDCRLSLHKERIGNRDKWVLVDRQIDATIGCWRKLPSCHLKQLRRYEDGNPKIGVLKGASN